MPVETPICDFGWQAPSFVLPATDGRCYALADIARPKGALVMFICNHCPYVKAVIQRIVHDVTELAQYGIGAAAICSNDATTHPDDGFDKMIEFARVHGFTFPYLHDESQAVARAYNAACTPDFFGFNADGGLQYRGRLDASRMQAAPAGAPRELFEAMRQIAETGRGPAKQIPSMGCSIKWNAAA